MSDAWVSLLVLAGTIGLFVWNRLPVGLVAVLSALALYVTGLLDVQAATAGFGDPIIAFIAALFVVSEGLDATGVTAWVGNALVRRAGARRVPLLVATMLLCAGLAAVLTPNGAAAALVPVVVLLSRRLRSAPSTMLIPLAFAASAGALLTLSGSPVNVIVSEASQQHGGPGFGYLEFAWIGVPLVAVTVLLAVTLGPRLLPTRATTLAEPDFSTYTKELRLQYSLGSDAYARARVAEGSPLVGRHPEALPGWPADATLVGVQAASGQVSDPGRPLRAGDELVIAGPHGTPAGLGLEPLGTASHPSSLLDHDTGVAELVVPPRSPLAGTQVFPGMRRQDDLTVLAVQRLGTDRGPRTTELAVGDTVLLRGLWSSITALQERREMLVVNAPDDVRRQLAPLGPRAAWAVAVLAGMVAALVVGVPPAIAGLSAAGAMILVRAVRPEQAYRAVSWETLVLIGGLIPLSTAIQSSGAAELLAGALVGVVGHAGPYVLLAALFLLTATLGQVISNAATVLIVVPIALAAATDMGVSPEPVLMMVAVAGAASFLTPIATPANMMVMGPGGYRFGDYWRFGLVVMAGWFAVAMALIPVVWPLHG